MPPIFHVLVPILQVLEVFLYPILVFVQWTAALIGLPPSENDILNLGFGFFPLLVLWLPLVEWFGDFGYFICGYFIVYAVFRVLFTISWLSFLFQHDAREYKDYFV